MCPELSGKNTHGFALPAAIFVLVVVAAMVVAMVRLNATQSAGVNLGLLSSRAYWAAMSGLEWGIYNVNSNAACFADTTKSLGAFDVVVTCAASNYQEAGSDSVVRYRVNAAASTRNMSVDDPDYVYRAAEVEILLKESS